jgi:hypothetical protein
MYRRVRSDGDCKFAPLLCGGISGIVMLLIVLLMRLSPEIPDLVRFLVMIGAGGLGGFFGGVLAMSLNYHAGRKYLSIARPK